MRIQQKHHQGFTLLELLVAMVIFSLMSVMAYGGLSNVITGNEVISNQEKQLKELQRTMMFLERDMRAGNPNPIGMKRSSLQRVRYDIEDKTLIRKTWAIIDHIDLEPSSMKLLNDIETFELRLLDTNNQWQENWKELREIPKAVEINIDHKQWGKITRLIPVQ